MPGPKLSMALPNCAAEREGSPPRLPSGGTFGSTLAGSVIVKHLAEFNTANWGVDDRPASVFTCKMYYRQRQRLAVALE